MLERGVSPLLHHLLDTVKVVVLEGGRAVGKTTLARRVGADRGFGTYFDLSEPADRAALAGDPHRVLSASATPLLIDEAQLEPEISIAVKRLVDRSDRAGQVLLTGSSRIGRGTLGGGDPLAGRAVRLRLNSFTQGELVGEPKNVLERWWVDEPEDKVYPELKLDALFAHMVAGGLPPVALAGAGGSTIGHTHTQRLLDAYVESVLTADLAGTRTNHRRLLQTFRYLASNPGQILNLSRAASELSMRAETVQAYLDVCRSSFLLDVAAAHRPTQHQTLTAHPRVFASDIALAAWAAGTSVERLLRDSKLSGALLENLVACELSAQAGWAEMPSELMHWRDTRARREVDLVLRRSDGAMLAIEVKSASQATMSDAKGLLAFAAAARGQVVRSLIIHTGRALTRLEQDVWAVPLASLIGSVPQVDGPSMA